MSARICFKSVCRTALTTGHYPADLRCRSTYSTIVPDFIVSHLSRQPLTLLQRQEEAIDLADISKALIQELLKEEGKERRVI